MLRALRPVGEAVSSEFSSLDPGYILDSIFSSSISFYQSGTASLAAALLAVKDKTGITDPEVIMPAYACPDIITAALFAGMTPRLVDFEANRTWMDLNQIEQQITNKTAAIVPINFLGIPERLKEIKSIIAAKPVALIEDRAQSFPLSKQQVQCSDAVILSFGRGKPVAILGGGALVCHDPGLCDFLPTINPAANVNFVKRLKYQCKIFAYNRLISPLLYGFIERLPLLKIGETKFKPLNELRHIDETILSLLASNIDRYQSSISDAQQNINSMLRPYSADGLQDLVVNANISLANVKLLRYPILMPSIEDRDLLFGRAMNKGLGVSVLYKTILPKISGLENILRNGSSHYPNAMDFANRLITLPVHSAVGLQDIHSLEELIKQ